MVTSCITKREDFRLVSKKNLKRSEKKEEVQTKGAVTESREEGMKKVDIVFESCITKVFISLHKNQILKERLDIFRQTFYFFKGDNHHCNSKLHAFLCHLLR